MIQINTRLDVPRVHDGAFSRIVCITGAPKFLKFSYWYLLNYLQVGLQCDASAHSVFVV